MANVTNQRGATADATNAVEPVDGLWDSAQTAAYLGIPKATLDQWAYLGRGPEWSKIGRHRRYRQKNVDAYVDANRHGRAIA